MVKVIVNATLMDDKMTGIGQYQYNLIKYLNENGNLHLKILLTKNFINSSFGKDFINLLKDVNQNTKIVSTSSNKQLYRLKSILGFYAEKGYIYHDLAFNSTLSYRPKAKVVTFHDAFFLEPHLWPSPKGLPALNAKYILPWSAKNADQIIVQTEIVKGKLTNLLGINTNKITKINMGNTISVKDSARLDNEGNNILEKFNIKKPFLLIVGAGHVRKRTSRIINIFKKMNSNYQLVITGKNAFQEPGIQESMENVEDNKVLILNYVTQRELEVLYKNMEALLFPSNDEGFGFPILEGLSYKKPVIASDIPVFKEVGTTLIKYMDVSNEEDVKRNIESIQEYKVDISRKQNEISNWLAKFTWEENARKVYCLYQELWNR
jgi:Glycosyltransferase